MGGRLEDEFVKRVPETCEGLLQRLKSSRKSMCAQEIIWQVESKVRREKTKQKTKMKRKEQGKRKKQGRPKVQIGKKIETEKKKTKQK